MPRTRPVIGVTLDCEPAGGWSKLPWYALRQNYFSALIEAGALPVALPHHPELAAEYLDALDGLLITGG
ncbi:MAG: gamma-glutamyl-gamma-aminobutyrate hydrolase family protein, partial [Acetobacteraceae bacterium]|nr:gamma-glutamyl-gamma-aminobutyrate hydrolase family protein [Acetobacteraceae bacterium]